MRFRKYGGLLLDLLLLSIASLIVFCTLGLYYLLCMEGGLKALLSGLSAALAVAVTDGLYALAVARLKEGGRLSDTVVMDGQGIRLEERCGQSSSIAWEEICRIVKSRRPRQNTRIQMYGPEGKTLWWYPANRKTERYILEQHPELGKLMEFDFK